MSNQLTQIQMETIEPANSRNAKPIQLGQPLSTSLACLLLLVTIELSIVVWTMYDKSIPCWDTAVHKLNSFYVYDLLQHPHLRHLDWYRNIFAVSQLYPPLFYIVSASFKFIFGQLANTELISNMAFASLLFGSLYFIARATFQNELAGMIAAVLVFFYPAVFWSAHSALLDFASIAMVGLGLAYFLWWSENPQPRRSLLLGLVFGLTTLTKNNTPIFFVGPILLDIIFALKSHNGKHNYARIKQLCIVGMISIIIILPWLILAGPAVLKFIASIQQQDFQVINSIPQSLAIIPIRCEFNWLAEFFTHLWRFALEDLPLILSPILCVCFLAALISIRPLHKNKIYLFASIIFALLLASAFRWPHQFRYIIPVAVPISILTAGLFAKLWFTRASLPRLILFALGATAFLQITYEAFSPYPLCLPTWTKAIMQFTCEEFKTKSIVAQMPGVSISPLPKSDWGILSSLLSIESASMGNPTTLMIMPNANPINCSPFYYLTKIRKDNIEVASPREHTELGDKVRFNYAIAMWYKWYILKTGDQGLPFCDTKSAAAYDKWLRFVHSSGLYKLVNQKLLSDGSTLQLYKLVDS